ncbi:CoA transferase subunit A [Sinanaerobacter sp. ZZT-01]|uniref:CoA transferase subunit A n=1 Tax=Sinanaerobacter sp. ZZT-01 TaxID=3111540 RepID=UPI002D791845|nr:CoA transferase subunit A [Sinanaerobacter sp. ZZT-01]WRR94535.1 CoA transferase subunit A [Sinanaerobacter sp. ZZT-01]
MINKIRTAEEAVAGIKDGATIMVGGFLGTGSPEILIDALVKKGVKHLTVIGNDGGLPANEGTSARGIGKLLEAGMVDHIIASHVGMNPLIGKGMNDGTLKCTLVPQGSLAEKIRAAGAGLGGVLTPTGVGTIVAEGKETINIDGKDYLLEKPIKADFALIRASICDEFGNFSCAKATKNFNYVMAMAAETVIIGAEKLVKVGEMDPDTFTMSGVFAKYIVGGEKPWQI